MWSSPAGTWTGPVTRPAGSPRNLRGPGTSVVRLDLASQSCVRSAAEEIRARFPRVDLLINNAGVMEIPYQRTEDGFELTLATNHLGPFALTGLLLDRLAAGARIVTVSSIGHLDGVIDFSDLQSERHYDPARAYSQSKLANLLFTYELDRRLRAAGADGDRAGLPSRSRLHRLVRDPLQAAAVPAQPGHADRQLLGGAERRMGALPALRAATDPSARGGEYFGPRRYGLRRRFYTGYPAVVDSSARSHDEADQARLWQVSEQLTGVSYALG